jgi:hypothetical protein
MRVDRRHVNEAALRQWVFVVAFSLGFFVLTEYIEFCIIDGRIVLRAAT